MVTEELNTGIVKLVQEFITGDFAPQWAKDMLYSADDEFVFSLICYAIVMYHNDEQSRIAIEEAAQEGRNKNGIIEGLGVN